MKALQARKRITPCQFGVFRIGFGLYLTIHFISLLPYSPELFSGNGILADAALNPLYGLFSNPLLWMDSILSVQLFVVFSVVLSVVFTLGAYRKATALLLSFVWACLVNRNNLINNPGIPYVGLLLILCALLPSGDRFKLRLKQSGRAFVEDQPWPFPSHIYWTAWILLAVGYAFSGSMKLQSPSWVNGEAILILLENPLARDWIVRDFALLLPNVALKLVTWTGLGLEIIFVFMSFHRITRMLAWTLMIGMHLGIVLLVDCTDLTLGMLMIHWFTFDPDWFPAPERLRNRRNVVFFDGVCVVCNTMVRFLFREDTEQYLYYAPLQGETFKRVSVGKTWEEVPDSIVFVEDLGGANETSHTRSTALIRVLFCLGGFWKAVGAILFLIPKSLRDLGYRTFAQHRYKWFGMTAEMCQIPSDGQRARLLN